MSVLMWPWTERGVMLAPRRTPKTKICRCGENICSELSVCKDLFTLRMSDWVTVDGALPLCALMKSEEDAQVSRRFLTRAWERARKAEENDKFVGLPVFLHTWLMREGSKDLLTAGMKKRKEWWEGTSCPHTLTLLLLLDDYQLKQLTSAGTW